MSDVRTIKSGGILVSQIDWEQRRYEIAREFLPYAAKLVTDVLLHGQSCGEGKTPMEASAETAVRYANALVAELEKDE